MCKSISFAAGLNGREFFTFFKTEEDICVATDDYMITATRSSVNDEWRIVSYGDPTDYASPIMLNRITVKELMKLRENIGPENFVLGDGYTMDDLNASNDDRMVTILANRDGDKYMLGYYFPDGVTEKDSPQCNQYDPFDFVTILK